MASFGSTKRHFWVAIFLLSAVVLALLIAVIVLAVKSSKDEKMLEDKPKNCYKSHCLMAAAEILAAVNTSVSPCENFYEHSCGAWIKSHKVSPDTGTVGTFSNVGLVVTKRVIDLLLEKSPEDEPDAIQKAKILFRSCMDLNAIENNSKKSITQALDMMKNPSDLVDLVIAGMEVGTVFLVPVGSGPNFKDTFHNIITVGSVPLILGTKTYYNKSTEGFAAFTQMIDGFSDMFLGKDMTEKLIDLEWKLKDIYEEWGQNASKHYNIFTVEQLHTQTKDQVNWLGILQKALNNTGNEVNKTTKVLVYYPAYVKKLADILNSTHLDTLKDYLILRYILKNINAMPLNYRNLYNNVEKAFKIAQVTPSRKKICAGFVSMYMPHVIGRLYIDNYFTLSSKKLALDLVTSLRNSLKKMFEDTEWMDKVTRTAAIEKVEAVLPFVGYDEGIKNDQTINMVYQYINFTENNFMENIMIVDMFMGKFLFASLGTNNSRTSWGEQGAAVVNAFYSPPQNAIFFPAGILQPPFYDAQYPLSMLFGAMGAVVGHEFTHGFDVVGAQFDKVGNLRNWWTAESMKQFKLRAAGLRKQYAAFPLCSRPPCTLHINGNLTLAENIADNGGVRTAFTAYKEYVKDRKIEEKVLPGLSYTSDQLFFVGYAHLWCQKIRREALVKQLLTDVHSPAIARVIATLQNTEAFSTAFNCKKNTRMNPTVKYGVW